jgi:LuxR family maltose regulon positive regulatory protein
MRTGEVVMEGDPSGGRTLLAAKTRAPRIRAPLVDRPRLLDALTRGVGGPLTVVSGAAGAGKTVLLSCWAHAGRAPGPVAWLTLDAEDDSPGAFWSYVIAALRRAGVPLPDDIGEPFLAGGVARPLLARLADALAGGTVPVVLVLDQFDVITRADIWRELDFVLRHSADLLRVVLGTRSEHRPSAHRYELRGEIVRIRNSDLTFTAAETGELLRGHGVDLSDDQLAALLEHTGGWAAGLRLSTVALLKRRDPEDLISALRRADETLSRYLVDEVLDGQSDDTREFLLRTSIVDQVCPPLADALTERSDGNRVLAALESGNVLTERVDDAPGWYRYHPLFSRVLREQLRERHPALVAHLHERAAVWFAGAGFLVEALRHAAEAGSWELAATTVVQDLGIGRLLAGREAGPLAGPLRDLPADQPGAMASVVRAALSLTRFELDACRDHLVAADEPSPGVPEDRRAALVASTAVIRAILARVDGNLEDAESALADGEAALARIPRRAAAHPETAALLRSSVGTVQLWTGRFPEAERTLRAGLAVADRPGGEYPRLNILGRLALLAYLRGRLTVAAALGEEELALAERSGLPVDQRTGAGHLALALVAAERGDRPRARRHLDDAHRSVGARHDPLVATMVPLLRARQFADARDRRRALAAIAQVPTDFGGRPLPPWLADGVALMTSGIHVERGDLPQATAALAATTERGVAWSVAHAAVAVAAGDRRTARGLLAPALAGRQGDADAAQVEAWLLTARLDLEERSPAAARAALRRALELARPEQRRRPFLRADAGRRRVLAAFPDVVAGHSWLGPPLTSRPPAGAVIPDGGRAPRSLPVERLTERESTVLERMSRAMSVEDIAEDLFLSVNTVKTHQRSIYRKLAVSRRNDAVRRGRELGLV